MMLWEIIADYFDNYKKQIDTHCEQNTESLNVKK
jgi:hypothetical protein